MENKKRYCAYCGTELIKLTKVLTKEFRSFDGFIIKVLNRFNTRTGERNTITVYECPKGRRKWKWLGYNHKHPMLESSDNQTEI
jgi:hypothetical protein